MCKKTYLKGVSNCLNFWQMNMVDEADDPTIDKPSKRRSVESPSPGSKRRKVGQYSLSLSISLSQSYLSWSHG